MAAEGGNVVVPRRAILACEMCRSRRTKCDGRRPACSFCESHGIQCSYRVATAPPPSRHDQEMAAIRERLDHLCGALSVRLVGSPTAIFKSADVCQVPPLNDYPLDESIISRHWRREFPFMTIQTPSMMCLLGLNPKLAAELVAWERTEVSTLAPPGSALGFHFHHDDGIEVFGAFYRKIHHWYPILSPETLDYYRERITGPLIPSSDSCLVLLIAAIGSVVRSSSIQAASEERPDAAYISRALSMLPNVHFEFSLTSVQCLILLSLYYSCIAKPCQAHDYILIASFKAQALFKCRLYEDDHAKIDLLRRSFWSILIIESDLCYHIDMPESNIWKFDDRILLPGIHSTWQPCREDQRELFNSFTSHSFGLSSDTTKAYFLAEILMCRMVRRCTSSVIHSRDQEIYAPIIAVELTYQLKSWHDHLPPIIRFDLYEMGERLPKYTGSDDSSYPHSELTAVTNFLKMQYYLCLTGIYWPAVYSVISTETLTAAPAADTARFFESYVSFVISAASAIPCCPQNPWSIYASLFITTMAAFKSAQSPCLQPTITPSVMRCFAIAAEIFERGDAVAVSPAISKIGLILRERVR